MGWGCLSSVRCLSLTGCWRSRSPCMRRASVRGVGSRCVSRRTLSLRIVGRLTCRIVATRVRRSRGGRRSTTIRTSRRRTGSWWVCATLRALATVRRELCDGAGADQCECHEVDGGRAPDEPDHEEHGSGDDEHCRPTGGLLCCFPLLIHASQRSAGRTAVRGFRG